jgi:hypothetical protein
MYLPVQVLFRNLIENVRAVDHEMKNPSVSSEAIPWYD